MKNKKSKNVFVTVIWWIFTGVVIILAGSTFFEFLKIFGTYSITTKNELFFFIGFIAYLVVHLLWRKPIWLHVLSHELTHALIGKLFLAKVGDMHTSETGGSVQITKTNFLISLSPYFVPLYALIFCLIFSIADAKYTHWLAMAIGAAMSFHFALTLYSMKVHQPDLSADSNFVFSVFFIALMNMFFIALIFSVFSDKIIFKDFILASVLGSAGMLKIIFLKAGELISQFGVKAPGRQ